MKHPAAAIAAAFASAMATLLLPVAAASAAPPAYATILFGRTGWQDTFECQPYVGSATLEDVVSYLSGQGIPAVGGVVTDPAYTGDTVRKCRSTTTYPTWADYTRLHRLYGFTPVSQSKHYKTWKTLTTYQQFFDESCATLPVFRSHGFDRAWGMFAYPSNDLGNPLGVQAVSSCFGFGRRYSSKTTTKASAAVTNEARTISVTSGSCNNPALACYAMPSQSGHYMMSSQLLPYLNGAPDTYSVVQFYRFYAQGSSKTAGPGDRWDCTGPEINHWSTRPEVTCMDTLKAAIALRSATVVFTDPATVAEAWGQTPPA